jgi:protein-S-isoprenylcysteine O-methyltransferase Ste14
MSGLADFVFRTAATRGRKRTLWSVAGTIFWYGGVALAVILSVLLDKWLGWNMSVPIVLRWSLAVIFLACGTPMVIWTIFRFFRARGTPVPFNPPQVFVTDGLYKYIRNPMHLGWALVLIGLSFTLSSLAILVFFLPVFIAAHILYLKLIEEKELEKKFGQSYLDYKKRVPMFFPRFRS